MDIVSHGLWGAITFGRKSRSSFWLAFVVGLAPDLLSFGILYAAAMLGLAETPDFSEGTPPESSIPLYVHHLYNVTHSFIVFPTPVLWPLFGWKFNGWQWTTLSILIPNFVLLTLLYAWYLTQPYRTKR